MGDQHLIDLDKLLNVINTGVAVYDVINDGLTGDDYIIVHFNKMALDHEAKSLSEIQGKSLKDLRPNIDEYGLIPIFREAWLTGEPQFYPARIYSDERFSNWYENRVFRLAERRIVALYDDVTETKEAQELLRHNEALLRELMNSFDKAIAIYRPLDDGADFEFVEMNAFAENITHYKRHEVLGKRISALFPGEASFGLIKSLRQTLESGEKVTIPLKQYKDDRITQWVENTLFRLPSGLVVAIFEDTYERRMAELALAESEEKLRSYFENAPVGIFITDIRGKCTEVNPAACTISGYSRQELCEKGLELAMPPEQLTSLTEHLSKAQQGRILTLTTTFRTRGGERRVWTIKTVAISSERLMSFVQDITELKQIEESLRTNQERFELAEQIGKVGNWEYDFRNETFWGSKEARRIYGFPPGDTALTAEQVESRIPERERVHQALIDLIEHNTPYNLEFDILPVDSPTPKTIVSIAQLLRDRNGRPLKVSGILKDVTERRVEQRALESSESRYKSLFNTITDAIVIIDMGQILLDCNDATGTMFGFEKTTLLGRSIVSLYESSDEFSRMHGSLVTHMERLETFFITMQFRRSSGELFPGEVHVSYLQDHQGSLLGAIGIIRDISKRTQLEEQIRHAQKMEAVGNLAGGIAHDFNNLITIINGYCESLLEEKSPHEPDFDDLRQILSAGERASELTQHLLAFSRKQVLQPTSLSINDLIVETTRMLRRTLGENITLEEALAPDLRRVMVDKGQMSQILINLAVNARDAMADGGTIRVRTANDHVDDTQGTALGITMRGDVVVVTLEDTGAGIPPQNLSKIFEPFFTTKERGQGTGMGLAMVYGIVKQTGGEIHVSSQVGSGTRFTIILPALPGGEPGDVTPTPPPHGMPVDATILLVEDEEALRRLLKTTLTRRGFTVISASDGEKAVTLARTYQGTIDLLLSDIVMPGISGLETAALLAEVIPHMKVLFMSGYVQKSLHHEALRDHTLHFIAKPFLPSELVLKINDILTT